MILEFKNLYKSYDKKEVLKGLSFKAESGRPLAFLGRNGAGKTTTIRILMDVIKKDGGEITIDGTPFRAKDFKIGYLPEERGMYQKVNILEQLIYFAELKGYNPEVAKKSARELLERVGLADYEKRKLEVLSKGNQQKVQISQALLGNPDIIIMDEPFSGLDPINSNLLKELILEKAGDNKLTLFSSHQMGYVDEICKDIAVLSDGVCQVNDTIEKVKRELAGNKVYVIPFETDLNEYSEILSKMGYESTIEKERVVVDLTGKERENFLQDISKAGPVVDSYGLYKPTLSDIFLKYAR